MFRSLGSGSAGLPHAVSEPATSNAPAALTRANEFIAVELEHRLQTLEDIVNGHALCIYGPLYTGIDDFVRDLIESRVKDDMDCKDLYVILTSNGGQVEPVQRIVEVIRHHYDQVTFIVPNFAYSAGTILAMSGDNIYMDYYGRLGPIDPQVRNTRGQYVPALGYLQRWKELLSRAEKGEITTAEVQVMLNFDQAELYMYEQAREQSIELLIEWLQQYKFKSWTETATNKTPVTPEMRKDRAEQIARQLSDSDRWHSHGRGISKDVLARDVNLQIDDLAANTKLNEGVKSYDHLLTDFMSVRGSVAALQVTTETLVLI